MSKYDVIIDDVSHAQIFESKFSIFMFFERVCKGESKVEKIFPISQKMSEI